MDYIVVAGDTLSGIAKKFGVTVADIQTWNGLTTTIIKIGQKLNVSDPIQDIATRLDGISARLKAIEDCLVQISKLIHCLIREGLVGTGQAPVPAEEPPAPPNSIPFWGQAGDAENWIKPDYSTLLPESFIYAGDPTDTLTLDWRDIGNTANPGPDGEITDNCLAGTHGVWYVTARTAAYNAISVGTTYNNLNSVWSAMLALASGTCILPECSVRDTTVNFNPSTPPVGGSHIIYRGAVDVDGFPATHIKPGTNATVAFKHKVTSSIGDVHLDVRNIRVGPFDRDITANGGETGNYCFGGAPGAGLMQIDSNYGTFTIRNCRIHRGSGNGIVGTAVTNKEWIARLNAELWVYDTEISACGITAGQGAAHNLYVHGTFLAGIRCYSHSAITHAWKSDVERCLLLNCVLSGKAIFGSGNSGVGINRVWNIEGMTEVYAYQTSFRGRLNATSSNFHVEFVGRQNSGGCINARRPNLAYFKIQDGTANSRKVEWEQGGLSGATHSAGVLSATVSSGTTVSFTRVGSPATQFLINNWRNLGVSNTYNVQIQLNTGSWHSTTGTVTESAGAAGVTVGTATMTLTDAIPSTANSGNFAIFKLTSQTNYDQPLLNEACHNPAHADYPWDTLNDGTGKADMADSNAIPQIIDRCVFHPSDDSSSVQGGWIRNDYTKSYWGYWSAANETMIYPLPPTKATDGSYSDPANAGDWSWGPTTTWPCVGSSASSGTGVASSAIVHPAVPVFADALEYDVQLAAANQHTNQIFNNNSSASRAPVNQPAVSLDNRYLDSSGVLQTANTNGRISPMTAPTQTTLSAGASAAATQVTVTSASGISTGNVIGIAMSGAPWSTRRSVTAEWFFTTVGGVSGTTITLDDALPYAVSSAAPVSVVVASGSKPAWWPDIGTWSLNA